jgi:SAM-dependent methyltransferase
MSQDIAENLENWNDRANVHVNGGYGDIDSFIHNPMAVSSVVRRDMAVLAPHMPHGSVQGSKLLHLQCHIGTDTLSWARLGTSQVWGLDFSAKALAYAEEICAQERDRIHFVEGDARYASAVMSDQLGSFDVIVTSVGTITWLPDLKDWAHSIAELLVDGGVFMIRDTHPLLFALDNDGLTVVQDYFSGTESTYDSDSSYTANSQGTIAHTRNHNWAHDFQELTTSLLEAGLTIEALGEHQESDWQALPMLEPDSDGHHCWRMPADKPSIPLTFSIVARKRG